MGRKDFSDLEDQIVSTVKNALDAIDFVNLKKDISNKTEDTLNEFKTYLHKFIEFNENSFYLINKQLINNMIEKAIIQYQKNYLDALDINKEKYQELQDKATILFTKVIYRCTYKT